MKTDADTPANSGRVGRYRDGPVMAILSQLAIVIGMVLVGVRHFDNIKTGIAAATLYLLLPYTAMWTGSVTHALPGALLVWAIVFYRWPLLAGAMIGLAFGTIYYPMFLLPLWISFYWQRGMPRFLIGVLAMVGVVMLAAALTSDDTQMFLAHLQQMFGLALPEAGEFLGCVGPFLAAHLSLSDHRRARRAEPQHGALAGAKESRHADQLFGRADAGHPILARPQRRPGAGLVPAAVVADDLPAEFGRPTWRSQW